MKPAIQVEDEQGEAYDDYQIEASNDMANDFIEENIIPQLYDFEFNNEDKDYLTGVATFALFARLCIELIGDGYTADQLKEIVDDFKYSCVSDTIH